MAADKTNDAYWAKLHELYSDKDWVTKPSMFAEFVKDYLSDHGVILELGAGLGQDSAYFTELGYKVVSTDLNIDMLATIAKNKFITQAVDIRKNLPFADNSFDVVYAHLSLHYFDEVTTKQIFSELYRTLKLGGLLAFLTNSTSDPEYGQGKQLEQNYFEIEGTAKRYFDIISTAEFAKSFKPLLVDNNGATYKDKAKDVHNLIRFIGIK